MENIYYEKLFLALACVSGDNRVGREERVKEAKSVYKIRRKDKFGNVWACIDMLKGKRAETDIKFRILKGGSYKIKQYYLENYKLNDIRGASMLLTHVEEKLIYDMVADKFGKECIIYNGGGNLCAFLPVDCDEGFAIELEKAAKELLISAGIAYYISEPIEARKFFGESYKELMAGIENELNNRKKLIINNAISAKSSYVGRTIKGIFGKDIKIDAEEINSKGLCKACGKYIAGYKYGSEKICASCLHKRIVGKELKNNIFYSEYEKYNGRSPVAIDTALELDGSVDVNSLSDIDRSYIAVVYGDGNNMGGIIQGFKNITELMKFSDDVKTTANKAVFEAMGECGIEKFEVVGLGGDDIFVIVSGKKAFNFAISVIKRFNEEINREYSDKKQGYLSTMSVGIAIGKTKTPVQVLLEAAEDKLKEAKMLSHKNRVENMDDGSLAFTVLDSFEGVGYEAEGNIFKNSLQPYSYTVAGEISEFIMKYNNQEEFKTKVRNILDAFEHAESVEEAGLFFDYLNAKSNKKLELPAISGYEIKSGYYKNKKDNEKLYIWRDMIDLTEFCE